VTITEKLQNNHASFSRRAQEIRAEWTLSDAAKRQELEGLNTEARSTHEQLTSQYRKDLSERLQKTRSEAFATPRVGKDPPLDVLVYRGALDRISKTRDTRELTHPRACPHDRRRALAKAVLFRGYEILAQATYQEAVERGFSPFPLRTPTVRGSRTQPSTASSTRSPGSAVSSTNTA
jgi:hypothetical protein